MVRRARFLVPAIGLQCLLAVVAVAILFTRPPAQGNMLVVPLAQQPLGEIVELVTGRGFAIVTPGRWPGSLVVRGERRQLGWALRDHGLLVIAGAASGCAAS